MGGTANGTGDERPDPQRVQTVPELKHALNLLRGTRSYKQLDRAAGGALAGSTVNNLLNGSSVPTKDTLVTFLAACGLGTDAQQPWQAAWERVSTAHLRAPTGAVRVRQTRPRLLGVHAAIRIDGAGGVDGELPPYVPRDLDADLRTTLTAAAASGGFVLLVGGSSVGKTRALFEAVRAVVPEWWLLHPADTPVVNAFAEQPTSRTVVWLDELQRYLNHPGGLPVGAVRSLLTVGVLVVATLWPEEYGSRTAPRVPNGADPYANDRELLGLAHVVTVPETLSLNERSRAEALAADVRIRTALDTLDAGFTQVLAAGPALINHWANAPADQCYGKAVITAALDVRRVGTTAPINHDLLAAAAPAYLTPTQQATAPADWLDTALTYATKQLHGAASTLAPVPAGMGRIAGYTVADYLHQHAQRIRRTAALPDAVWQALVDHHHPDDTARLAHNADRRGRPNEAIALHRRCADASDDYAAAASLDELLADRGDVEGLCQRADAGDDLAAVWVANLLAERGDVEGLRQRADASEHWAAAERLADLLAERGDVEGLRQRADAGHDWAAVRLADLLAERGEVDQALAILSPRADAGDRRVADRLTELLAERGEVDQALAILSPRADAGATWATARLVRLLAERGDVEGLRQRADAGEHRAAEPLADLLAERGDVEGLRQRADAGDRHAAGWLAEFLAARGDVEGLRQRADAGDWWAAAGRLAELLAGRGDVEGLVGEIAAGTARAANLLAALQAGQSSS